MKSPIRTSIRELYDIYMKNRVYRYAAAFSYYVTLSFFPLLILISIMVAPFHITFEGLTELVNNVVPTGIIQIIKSHLLYVSNTDNDVMMWSALIVLFTTASAAFRVLLDIMTDVCGKPKYNAVVGFLLSFIFAVAILGFIYLACIVVVMGRWVTNLLESHFNLLVSYTELWLWMRYLILLPLMYFFVQCIYIVTTPKGEHKFSRTAGAVTATIVLVLVSMVFSSILSMSNKYTVVYGSLASIAILMIWLFCCGIVLIMGNAINVVVDRRRMERRINNNAE